MPELLMFAALLIVVLVFWVIVAGDREQDFDDPTLDTRGPDDR